MSVLECFVVASSSDLLLYLSNATFEVDLPATFVIEFPPLQSGDVDWQALSSLAENALVRFSLRGRCVTSGTDTSPAFVELIRSTTKPPEPVKAEAARVTTTLGSVVAVSVAGTLALQMQRSTAILGMVQCTPDFGEQLGFLDNPFQVTLGPASYGQFVAAASLNHVLLIGLPIIHGGIGATYARVRDLPIREGFVWARFPSLSILPANYWLSSTVSAAMVVGIYGEARWHMALAVVSMALCVAIPAAVLVYLRRNWGARMILGIVPARQIRIEAAAAREEPTSHKMPWLRWIGLWAEWWIDGGVEWRDQLGRRGYCRGSRILFMDYTEKMHWFLAVELFIAIVVGVLDGVRLGPRQCEGNLLAIIGVLVAFLVMVIVLRPYNAPFGAIFTVVTTLMQIVTAALTAAWMFGGSEAYKAYAETVVLMSLYLLLGKAVLDLLPKLKDVVLLLVAAGRRCCDSSVQRRLEAEHEAENAMLERSAPKVSRQFREAFEEEGLLRLPETAPPDVDEDLQLREFERRPASFWQARPGAAAPDPEELDPAFEIL